MAFKRAEKKNMKIIAATSMVLFSLFAAFSGVVAWFTSVHNVNNEANGFVVAHDDSAITVDSVYCVKYDGIYGATATRLTSDNNDLVMSEYDSIFTDRNINTPLFLRIAIADYQVTNNTTKSLTIIVPSNGDYTTGNNTTVNNYLSNVVCVKFSYGLKSGNNVVKDEYDLTNNTYLGGDIITLYEGMRDRAAELTTPYVKPFVTNASTGAKDSVISITIPTNTIPTSFIDDEVVIVYIEFDYYVTNSVNLVKNYLDSYTNPGSAPRVFNSDIQTMKIKDN